MESILVTGGVGFIGSHVVDNLRNKGFKVTIFDRFREKYHRDDVGFFLGDVKDRDAVIEAVGHHDGVIHLAAILGTQETIHNPIPLVEVNILGSINVFDACKMHNKKAVYIGVGNYWMNNPYSITKTTAERFVLMYNKEHNTKIALVRGLNAYGPRQKHKPVRKIAPNFILPALRNEDIMIYGDGTQIMDMIYVTDLAEILVQALLTDKNIYYDKIEAGMGKDTTVNEIAELIIKLTNSKSQVIHVPMRPGEEPKAIVKADIDTLKYIDYDSTNMITLEEGLKYTIEYYKKNLSNYN